MNPFTTVHTESVAAQGELRLIAAIRKWLGSVSPKTPFGIGDDCAVIPPTKRHQLVTTDPVIYGHHFDDSPPGRAVGGKLLKRNLSDIAAMGGRPVAAVISLAIAPETCVAWLRDFYLGLAATARRYRVKIVGGDITQAPAGFVGAFLTLHGESSGTRVITRTGAKIGDHIFVTGTLGGSLLRHHYDFTPRLAEGAWLSRRPEVRAMMDVSDGIAKDLDSLTSAGTAPQLIADHIPLSRAAFAQAKRSGRSALHHALCDGEDFELLFVTRRDSDPEKLLRAWRKKFPRVKLSLIGKFVRKDRVSPDAIRLGDYHGYEHLR